MKELFQPFWFRRHWLAKVPLWALLTIPFIFQLVGSVGLVGYLSYRNGQQAVQGLTEQLMNQAAVRIDERLNTYLQIPQQLVQQNLQAVEAGELNLEDFQSLEAYFFRQAQIFQSVTTLTFGNVAGETVGVARDHKGVLTTPNALVALVARGAAPNTRYFYAVDDRGQHLQVLHTTRNYDARQRGWYRAAIKNRQQSWSPVFPILNLPLAAVSAVTPVYQQGELKGVLSSDVMLSDISLFLHSLNFSPAG
jgi:hypothetical protein